MRSTKKTKNDNDEMGLSPAAESVIDSIRQSLPSIFTREVAASKLGGLLGATTLKNIDHRGEWPETKVRMGKKVLYERDNFIDWLKRYYKLE